MKRECVLLNITVNCWIKIYFVEHKYKLLNINMQVVEFYNIWLTMVLASTDGSLCKTESESS